MTVLALVKAFLLLGAILLVGGGVTVTLVAPELSAVGALRHRVVRGAVVGAGLLLLGSAFDIVLTLRSALGRPPSLELLYGYLGSTHHGHAVLLRTVLVGLLLLLTFRLARRPARPAWFTALYLVMGCSLLGTFSYTSHAAAMGGTPPFIADLTHFAAATVWAGSLFYLAALPNWGAPYQAGLQAAFRRVSLIGLLSVLTLFLTGVYTTLIHLQEPARFIASPYGLVLYAKVALVLVIVRLAALNRFWLLPAFLYVTPLNRTPSDRTPLDQSALRFRRVVRFESVLLIAVLLVTGLLTTSALPHGSGETGAWTNLVNLIYTLRGE